MVAAWVMGAESSVGCFSIQQCFIGFKQPLEMGLLLVKSARVLSGGGIGGYGGC